MKAKEFIPASKPRNFVAKNQKTAGAGAHKDKKKAEKQGDVKHKGRQFDESSLEEYGDTAKGQKMLTKVHKRAVDRMIKADDQRDAKGAKKNQQTANRAWDRFGEKEKYGESVEVMEYETHRYTDDQGNEWEVNDEGERTLVRAAPGSSYGRSSSRYNRPQRYKPFDMPSQQKKGMYFYNVNDPQTAQKLGLKQSKSGKWYLPAGSLQKDTADKVFGAGKYWEPKK